MTSFRIEPLVCTPTPQQQQLLKEQRPPGHWLLSHIAKPGLFKYIYKQLPFSNCSVLQHLMANGYVATTNRCAGEW
ncbi:hypothetical protein I7I48_09805 [Histoplasma ohiense]|nr:hypothetical protein I7I48_09805 [Histoplasma ohiense (nom. inval.)]